jgi:hypothetical protein
LSSSPNIKIQRSGAKVVMDITQFTPAADLERCVQLRPVCSIKLREIEPPTPMLRIHGDRNTLLACLIAEWAQQL